jgi:hypothetical protein
MANFQGTGQTCGVLTVYGVAVLTFMMLMYALERRGEGFVLAFSVGCVLASSYGFLAGTWPFGLVELIWAAIALNRYMRLRRERHGVRP